MKWEEVQDRVSLQPGGVGVWVALLAHEDEALQLMATGGSKSAALNNLRLRFDGHTPKNERPYLKLCTPCNRRAAEAEEEAYTKGVEVCVACAVKIDRWTKEFKQWEARTKRNARKRSKRQRSTR
jgi:hypothetical protein